MLSKTYYAQHYAGIIVLGLLDIILQLYVIHPVSGQIAIYIPYADLHAY